MHPAPSVIAFTVLSGAGFGVLTFLALGHPAPHGWPAFLYWGAGYGLATGGLLASTLHLGNPQRALLAFTQWRSSWLSREAWASVAALLSLAPIALSDWLTLGLPRWMAIPGALLAALTILCTAMIYAQLKTIPRWNHWTTPATFALFALSGGAILAGQAKIAPATLLLLAALLIHAFRTGETRFQARGHTLATATGLVNPTVFELPHTGGNYLMREMIHVVARKHALKLQIIAVVTAALIPAALIAAFPPHPATFAVAALVHLTGALTARWLFFATAEHVVGLYYGRH
jgi:sulfite dehydrogenase (quinone) subunit SoeC